MKTSFENHATLSLKPVLKLGVEFLIGNAVLYYLSCLLLLVGTYWVMHSPWLHGSDTVQNYETYGMFQSYVILLAGLCLLVLRRLSLVEDGLVMAGLALLLILDPTFFSSVFCSQNLTSGLVVNSTCFVLDIVLLVALWKIGRVPWKFRFVVVTILASFFVRYYPAAVNAGWQETTTTRYCYLLWWMPLIIAMSYDQIRLATPRQAKGDTYSATTMIGDQTRRRFLMASMLVVFFVVLSHAVGATYAYSVEYQLAPLAPALLGAGVLLSKLRPDLGPVVRQLLWICGILAALCSFVPSPDVTLPFAYGLKLSPYHLGTAADALFCSYLWRRCRSCSWLSAAALCLLFVIGGNSLADAVLNILNFHFVPYFFLAAVFAVASIAQKRPVYPVLAGLCLAISILSRIPVDASFKFVVFLQSAIIWTCLIHRYYFRDTRRWICSLGGVVVFLISIVMCSLSPNQLVWRLDFVFVIAILYLGARILRNRVLWATALIGGLSAVFYLVRNKLAFAASELQRTVHPGLALMILAFLLLPVAYFFSTLRIRRREKTLNSESASKW